jgi:hypothetical protein
MILHLKMLEETVSYEFSSKVSFLIFLQNYYYVLMHIILNEIIIFSCVWPKAYKMSETGLYIVT